ncbi:glycoside hydrolase family 97 protein [Rhizosphaericola mali]|uniref:Glycoside hydrolase family 97 protein n=1 Tax=Rhizosphaericola mali TaxID=2545455 RepID=A0A5P2G5T1_9BACT|nr:glycoside hydrolase family 97 protein [Rhizosphaericola mali]QES89120.1 glycoside hydrolase family 97 protein [Rhizosphaericola mali]
MLQRSLLFFSIFIFQNSFAQQAYTLQSPNNKLKANISISDSIRWNLSEDGSVVIKSGVAALAVEQYGVIGWNEKVKSLKKHSAKDIIYPTIPIRSKSIANNYNDLIIQLKSGSAIDFRLFNNGIAYSWITNFKDSINVTNEIVDIEFPSNKRVFWGSDNENKYLQSHYEQIFKETYLESVTDKQDACLPLYVGDKNNPKVLISESNLLDYSNLFFLGTNSTKIHGVFPKVIAKDTLYGDRGTKILENHNYIARTIGTRSFPWRVFMVANQDKDLLENNLVFQLASPNVLKETDWIKPGLVAWDWWNDNNIYGVNFKSGINNDTYKYYIDFAAKYKLPYLVLDEGWSKSTWDITHNANNIDVEELVRYGKSKNVDIILWTLWQPMDKDMETVLDTYQKWGVKGVKVDFMARADQYMVNFYERLASTAAKHRLMVDLHGAYKPVGLNRKYPNIVSYEGVKGLENYKWTDEEANPPHDVTIPFTRMVVGPMDYTPGAMRNVIKKNYKANVEMPMSEGTRAHQVAMYAVYESPLQMLADNPSNYLKDSSCTAYMTNFPTTWDSTVAIDGDIKEFVLVARKHGNNWYIGGLNNWNKRELDFKLDFLDKNTNYKVQIFKDGVNADKFAEDYILETAHWKQNDAVHISMQSGGGWSAILTKE